MGAIDMLIFAGVALMLILSGKYITNIERSYKERVRLRKERRNKLFNHYNNY